MAMVWIILLLIAVQSNAQNQVISISECSKSTSCESCASTNPQVCRWCLVNGACSGYSCPTVRTQAEAVAICSSNNTCCDNSYCSSSRTRSPRCYQCPVGRLDCDKMDSPGNPCECVSSAANTVPMCFNRTCASACNTGFGDCDGNNLNGCETETTNNATHCGSCGAVCPSYANSIPTCSNSTCDIQCLPNFVNCDANITNGCETLSTSLLTDPRNCGFCGTDCSILPYVSNATCTNGNCSFQCNGTFQNCDSNPLNGCESNVMFDPLNCGACGSPCPQPPNTVASCNSSVCSVACRLGYSDCNANMADGCETAITTATNCGACGRACPMTPNNTMSGCTADNSTLGFSCMGDPCNPGFADCNTNPLDGCEVNVLTSVENCGLCRYNCSQIFDNSVSTCANGVCQLQSCLPGYSDCDQNPANGCEVLLSSSPSNCGNCGTVCSFPNGVPGCSNGTCVLASCMNGFYNNNGNDTDGCESTCFTDADCEKSLVCVGNQTKSCRYCINSVNSFYTPLGQPSPFRVQNLRLSGGFLSGYISVDIALGDPSVIVDLLIDSGSSDLFVITNQTNFDNPPCPTCLNANYAPNNRSLLLSCTNNLTSCPSCQSGNCGFSIAPPLGISGSVYSDQFGILDHLSSGVVGVINRSQVYTPNALVSYGGILGLSVLSRSNFGTQSPVLQILNNFGYYRSIGLCLTNVNGGTIHFGINIHNATTYSNVKFVDMVKDGLGDPIGLHVQLNAFSVGLVPFSSSDLASLNNNGTGLLIDTASPLIQLSTNPDFINNFVIAFKQKCSTYALRGVCESGFPEILLGNCYNYSAVELSFLPELTLVLGNQTFILPSSSIFLEQNGEYCTAITFGTQTKLGSFFMSKFFTVFDFQTSQIGFAPVSYCTDKVCPATY